MANKGYRYDNLRHAFAGSELKLIEAFGPAVFNLSQAAKQAVVFQAEFFCIYRFAEI